MPIQSLSIENFAAFQKLEWNDHASLNVIIGVNDTGKTHLLKLLYAITRSVEEFWKKQVDPKELHELLASKLRWTFLPPKMRLGELVTHGIDSPLHVFLKWNDDKYLNFSLARESTTKIETSNLAANQTITNTQKATFLPTKEILSIFDAIVATRESQEITAFDDTYYDLVKDYRHPLVTANFFYNAEQHYKKILQSLNNIIDGELDIEDGDIVFRRGEQTFNMHQTAEGIKKIAILSRLMRNNRITRTGDCVLFVDEPEANLNPQAIVLFADILHELAQSGIQVYLTTHSYFLLKRLEQLARQHKTDYALLDLRKQEIGGVTGTVSQLKEGLPMNPIVEESLNLFDNDVALDLGM